MGANSSKGRVEIDVNRQAWVRTRPNPAHPKHQGLNRAQSAAGVRPQTTRRQQHYDIPPNYYQQEPERPIHGRGDVGRSRHDERGVRRAQSSRSQSRLHRPFFDDDSDDEAGVPLQGHRHEGPANHDSRGLSRGQHDEVGMPLHGHRHEGPAHHNSRGSSRGHHGSRGISHARSNSGHGGPGQQEYDFAPPVDHVRAQYAASRGQQGSEHDSQYGIRHGSQRSRQHDSQHGIRHGSHRDSQRRSQG